jgi:hypothetical protein
VEVAAEIVRRTDERLQMLPVMQPQLTVVPDCDVCSYTVDERIVEASHDVATASQRVARTRMPRA